MEAPGAAPGTAPTPAKDHRIRAALELPELPPHPPRGEGQRSPGGNKASLPVAKRGGEGTLLGRSRPPVNASVTHDVEGTALRCPVTLTRAAATATEEGMMVVPDSEPCPQGTPCHTVTVPPRL